MRRKRSNRGREAEMVANIRSPANTTRVFPLSQGPSQVRQTGPDTTMLWAAAEGDAAFAAEMINELSEAALTLLTALGTGFEAGDLCSIAKAAHTLQGVFAVLGQEGRRKSARDLEFAARAEDRDQLEPMTTRLCNELLELLAEATEMSQEVQSGKGVAGLSETNARPAPESPRAQGSPDSVI